MADEILEIAFTRRSLRALDTLVGRLRAAGLDWIEVHDVAGHVAAVTEWQGRPGDLHDLCARTGWPLPTPSGPDHTTPAAMAVTQAKRRLEKAMLLDNRAGASANEVAERAGNVYSRPIALDILAGERLLDQAVTALAPWFGREVPLHIHPGPARSRRTLELTATWEGEAPAIRREQLKGVDEALAVAGLGMRDAQTKTSCDSAALLLGDHAVVELYPVEDKPRAA
ncbi:hypothetical protein [Kitasatospora sp. GAS204B]|uniref:hypothetical protein n=1 Tax=unclassified Kitasatospora TaxID=2633591 RepID=UPI002474A113|nr:hypothetical protein [Kitasatospora sp. GAS204B]MDH6122385.1 hypothetical protein [Kitasatospora sp. GAS204B]